MRKTELTKKMNLEVPEHITSVIDGDKLSQCVNAVIMQYRRMSNHRDAETIQKVFNALLEIPDIYLFKEED